MRIIDEPVVYLPNSRGPRTRAAHALGLAWPPDDYDPHAYESGVVMRHNEGRYLVQLVIAFDWENEDHWVRAGIERSTWNEEMREIQSGKGLARRKNQTTFKDWCQRLKFDGIDGTSGSDALSI